MINIRAFNRETDIEPLNRAIEKDTLHPGEWTVDHFTDPTLYAEVIEDDNGPIIFSRYTKILRISCVWADPENRSRNARAVIKGMANALQNAKASGYTEVIVLTNHPPLAEFLKQFGFAEAKGEYLLQI